MSLEDRQNIAAMIKRALREGARLKMACDVGGIDARTLQPWETNGGLRDGDARPRAVRPVPAHALSPAEREQILRLANEPQLAALSPARIVPILADEEVYIASESIDAWHAHYLSTLVNLLHLFHTASWGLRLSRTSRHSRPSNNIANCAPVSEMAPLLTCDQTKCVPSRRLA